MGILQDCEHLSRHSHTKVSVACDYGFTKDCRDTYELQYRDARDVMDRNNGKIICFYCSREVKYSGRSNPNCKHVDLDDKIMEIIDTEQKSYLLGWIGSDGTISDGTITIAIHKKDIEILYKLRDIVCQSIQIKRKNDNMVSLSICSKEICSDVCRHLNIEPGKKSDVIEFPRLDNDHLTWAFIRGYFDGDGFVARLGTKKKYPRCGIASDSKNMLDGIRDFTQIACSISGSHLEYSGSNAIDFLGKIYDGSTIYLNRKYQIYIDWACWVPSLCGFGSQKRLPQCLAIRTHKEAILPSKLRASDIGYDLTIISKIGDFGYSVMYDTGIKVQLEHGWYAEVFPRSSLSKTGYMMGNSVGIIDRAYIGTIKIALIKINANAPELELPFRGFQLIFKQALHFEIVEVNEGDFIDTERGEKGFGSSNKRQKITENVSIVGVKKDKTEKG